jgi:hypothetical protein
MSLTGHKTAKDSKVAQIAPGSGVVVQLRLFTVVVDSPYVGVDLGKRRKYAEGVELAKALGVNSFDCILRVTGVDALAVRGFVCHESLQE